MQKQIELDKSRKFHDMWAFIIYLITLAGSTTFLIINVKSKEIFYDSKNYIELGKFVLKNLCLISLLAFITFNMFIFMPKVLIYLGLIAPSAVLIALTVIAYKNQQKYFIQLLVTTIIVLLISILVYYLYIQHHIDYMAKMVSTSTKILFEYFGTILALMFTIFLVATLQCTLLSLNECSHENTQVAFWFNIFAMIWTTYASSYFFQVFVSALIASHLTNLHENKKEVGMAFKISFFALGSICLGALLHALITTLRMFAESVRHSYENDNRGRSLILLLLLIFLQFLISIFESIIETLNKLAFPYLAIHGTNYKDSLVESTNLILGSNCKYLASFFGIDLALNMLVILYGALLIFLNIFLFSSNLHKILGTVAMGTFVFNYIFLCIGGIFSLISAGCLALIFVSICSPAIVENYDEKLSVMIKDKRDYLDGTGVNETSLLQ